MKSQAQINSKIREFEGRETQTIKEGDLDEEHYCHTIISTLKWVLSDD